MSLIMSFLSLWHWLGLAIILVILEILLGASFFLLVLGLCSLSLAIILAIMPHISWQYQCIIFVAEAVLGLSLWYYYLVRCKLQYGDTNNSFLNRRSRQYVGRVLELSEPIINGRGRAKVGDTMWTVSGVDLPAGAKVKVVDVDGVILKVELYQD